MKRIFNIISSIFFLSISTVVYGQLTVQPDLSAQEMATSITGNGVTILDPIVIGAQGSFGGFEASGIPGFNLQNGVLLTTGKIIDAVGPNLAENTTTSHDNSLTSDVLSIIADPLPIKDACTLEFDIIPDGDTLRFNFSFASEEYAEFVCTPYDDIFGFFISGPGIVGDPGLNGKKNIALIPGQNIPITINNVNHGNPTADDPCLSSNEIYHVENPLSAISAIQYDGWTTGIQAIAGGLIPCEKYHLEIVIADVNDRLYDSGVFIEKIESNNVQVAINTIGNIQTMIEACNNGIIEFCANEPVVADLTLEFLLEGTAVNGVDYDAIGDVDPAVVKTVVIPAGSTCAFVNINTIDDGVDELDEYVDVILLNPICDGLVTDSVRVYLIDELQVEIAGDDSICSGESVFLEAIGDANTYQWGPPSIGFVPNDNVSNPIVTLEETTTISVTTTVAGCVATDDFIIDVTNFDFNFTFIPDGCSPDTCTGSIILDVTGGVMPYSYDWGNGDTTSTITGVCAGTYTLSVIDAFGCTRRDTVELEVGSEMTVLLSALTFNGGYNVACNGDAGGSITAIVSGAVGDVTYLWDDVNNSTTASISGLSAGTYTVTVLDSQGCEVMQSITLTEPDPLLLTLVNVVDVVCGGNTGALEVSVSGGTPGYTLNWMQNGVLIGTGTSIANLPAGIYTVNVSDQNNCSSSMDFEVGAPANPLSATSIVTDVNCFGDDDGSILVQGQGGTINPGSDYQYLWLDDNSIDPLRENLTPGLYQVQISDDNNCTMIYSVTVMGPNEAVSVNVISQNNITCSGSCTVVEVVGQGGTAGYTYEWNTVPASVNPLGINSTLEICIPGDYVVQVADANGCVSTANMTIVIESPPMSINATVTDVNCDGDVTGEIDVTVNGGVLPYASYVWTSTCGMGPFFTEDINNICAGTWTLTVVDAVGCSQSFDLAVSVLSNISLTAAVTPTLCVDDSSGAINITPLNGVGNYTYEWFGPAAFIGGPFDMNNVIAITQDITGKPKGEYLVIITDQLGCTYSQEIIITAPAAIIIDLDDMSSYNGFGVSCNGSCDGFLNVTVAGGTSNPVGDYNFIWKDQTLGFEVASSGIGGEDIANLCASQDAAGYELIVIDDNNCIQNAFFPVTEPDPIMITFSAVTDPSCSGGSNGTITAQVSGGVPGYTFEWRAGNDINLPIISTSLVLADQPAGMYCLTVNDINGCSNTECITLTNPPMLDVNLSFVNQNGFAISCFGETDGTILSNVLGGDGNYQYTWSDCVNAPFAVGTVTSVAGLSGGTYCLEVIDGSGCTGSATIFLPSPTQVSNNAVVENLSCDNGNGGSITLNPTGGSGTYPIIDWSPDGFIPDGQTSGAGLPAGSYQVYVEDSNGCSANFDFVIAGAEAINVVLLSPQFANGFNVSCNGFCDASIEATIVGGSGAPTITWTGPAPVGGAAGNPTQFDGVVCAGVYTIEVTDGVCSGTDEIIITQPTALVVDIQVQEAVSCSGICDGQLVATASGGGGGYIYQWDGQAPGPITQANLCIGEHCVTVTDISGCSITECFTVSEPDPIITSINSTPISCNAICDGTLMASAVGGDGNYSFVWTGPDNFMEITPVITDLCPGNYNLLVTDGNGCQGTNSFNLIEPEPINIEINVGAYNGFGVSCASTCDGTIDVVNLGGGVINNTWEGPGNPDPVANIANLCIGTYILTSSTGGTCARVDTIVITAPEPIVITLDSELFPGGTNISCVGDATGTLTSVVVGGVENYTYTWVTNNDTIATGVTEVDGLIAGVYSLIIVDANGCVSTESYTLTEPDEPFTATIEALEFPGGSNTSCGDVCDGEISSEVSNGFGDIEYNWSGPNGFLETSVTSIDSLCPGIYVLIVTDENQCTAVASDTLIAQPMIEILSSVDSVFCFGQNNGNIDVTVLGGTPEYTYEWIIDDETSDEEDLEGIPAGTYSLTVTDSFGCMASQEFVLMQPDTIMIGLVPSEPMEAPGFNISAPNAMDGSINATIDGGVEPYSYEWVGPDGVIDANDPFINELSGGQYCVNITDAKGCLVGRCIELLEPLELHLPHGMSPNEDGINDGLVIEGLELYEKNIVRVFNRWGNIVFERNDYANDDPWKGEGKNGNYVADGTYFVIVELINSEKELHGYLEVRR